ncbi:MAG: NAD(P)-dependent oxidoreductase [Candidatus Omnitrophica bacterium]|nr:NAD(P)-dependent oxidoreductase [Candidatus Omnitrophota bacterium]
MNLPKDDLEHISHEARDLFKNAYKKNFFITGGTGYFGSWLLESFAWINDLLKLKASLVVLSRDPGVFINENPSFKKIKSIEFLKDDMRLFKFPKGKFHYIIHAATDNNHSSSALDLFRNNIAGTQRVLDFAKGCHNEAFLFISSGAVYGTQPSAMTNIPEDYPGAPSTVKPHSAYAESKRVSEFYCANYAKEFGINAKIARCFAFLGPKLPLNANYAVGNFVRDALKGGPICVKSDKPVYRSYLYSADLMIWLWTILFKGQKNKPYNVGSSEPCSILDLAELVAKAFSPKVKIRIQDRDGKNNNDLARYIPDTNLARNELGLRQLISLEEGISKMVNFYRS